MQIVVSLTCVLSCLVRTVLFSAGLQRAEVVGYWCLGWMGHKVKCRDRRYTEEAPEKGGQQKVCSLLFEE